MDTAIGAGLKSSSRLLRFCVLTATIIVGIDLITVAFGRTLGLDMSLRFALALLGLLCWAFVITDQPRIDGNAFGFRLSPRKGWLYWLCLAIVFNLIFTGITIILAIYSLMHGISLPRPKWESALQALPFYLYYCFTIPLLEEVIYRLVFCPPIASWIGARWCIVVNGLVFVGLHYLYGNLGLAHLVGGFLLSWSFLKSETLLVPIALHASINFCYASWLVVCYVLLGA